MPLFLVTCVCDEGLYDSSFRVVEATSRLAVAQNMLQNPRRWRTFLNSAYKEKGGVSPLFDYIHEPNLTAELLLQEIDRTYIDGDSFFQLRIYEIQTIEKID